MKMARALATVTRHSRRFKVTLVEILTLGMGAVTRFSSSNRDMPVNSPISPPVFFGLLLSKSIILAKSRPPITIRVDDQYF